MKIGHVHLRVSDLPRAEKFYQDILGASVSERVGTQYSFLTFGASHHEVALQQGGVHLRGGDAARSPLYHTAFEVATKDDLLNVLEKLKDSDSRFSLIDHGISWALYTHDPDGNGVEVYVDRRFAQFGQKLWQGKSYFLPVQQLSGSEHV